MEDTFGVILSCMEDTISFLPFVFPSKIGNYQKKRYLCRKHKNDTA